MIVGSSSGCRFPVTLTGCAHRVEADSEGQTGVFNKLLQCKTHELLLTEAQFLGKTRGTFRAERLPAFLNVTEVGFRNTEATSKLHLGKLVCLTNRLK